MIKKVKKSKIDQRKIIALGTLTFILVTLGYLAYELRALKTQLNWINGDKVAHLTVLAVENLSIPVPEDARSGIRYIPEAKVTLPADSSMDRQLVYHFVQGDGELQSELTLGSRTAIGAASSKVLGGQGVEGVFEHVPELQSCSRGFLVTFIPYEHAENPLTFEKRLQDGRTVYVYANMACDMNRESVTDYLRQIESY